MRSNNTLININDDKFKSMVVNWSWKLIKYFLPSGTIAFLGIKSAFWFNFLITILPSIIGTTIFLSKLVLRYFFIKRRIDKTFGKKWLIFEGNGYYFLNLIEEIKKARARDENNNPSIALHESKYVSKFKISYSPWKSKLMVTSETESGGVRTSSYSDAFFSFVKFSSTNFNDFEIFFSYQNNKHSSAELNSSQIRNLNDHVGYGRIVVKSLKVRDFTYVSDFTARFSFGSFLQNPIKKTIEQKIERN